MAASGDCGAGLAGEALEVFLRKLLQKLKPLALPLEALLPCPEEEGDSGRVWDFRGNHLSNATCLTHVFFKSG